MIKIVSRSTVPVASTVALVNLCNQFNARGYLCSLYGPDSWHLDKCKSGNISDFYPESGDIIIVHDIKLLSTSELYDLQPIIKESRKDLWLRTLKSMTLGYFGSSKKPDNVILILSCQSDGQSCTKQPRLSLFHKIHCLTDARQIRHKAGQTCFVCPNFVDDLKASKHKPSRFAGVIGNIRKENKLELSIEKALHDGMQTVIIFGYLSDPLYYYNKIEPLTKVYPGKIKYAGFVDDKQKLYDSVSDVYCSVSKPWSTVRQECLLTNTNYHGTDSLNEEQPMTNEQIFLLWKTALGLR